MLNHTACNSEPRLAGKIFHSVNCRLTVLHVLCYSLYQYIIFRFALFWKPVVLHFTEQWAYKKFSAINFVYYYWCHFNFKQRQHWPCESSGFYDEFEDDPSGILRRVVTTQYAPLKRRLTLNEITRHSNPEACRLQIQLSFEGVSV